MTLEEHILEEEKMIRSFATIAYDTRLHDENGELMWKAEQYEKSQHEHEERKSLLEELEVLRKAYGLIAKDYCESMGCAFCDHCSKCLEVCHFKYIDGKEFLQEYFLQKAREENE